jgi:hypothetical protein
MIATHRTLQPGLEPKQGGMQITTAAAGSFGGRR